jgi:hypothetical protein
VKLKVKFKIKILQNSNEIQGFGIYLEFGACDLGFL